MEKYTAAAKETTDATPELVAHVAKTLDGVSKELAGDLVAGVKDADVVVLANDSASMGTAQDEWRWGETKLALERLAHVLDAVGNEGYRVQFLNEGAWKHVTSPAEATQLFEGVRCDPTGSKSASRATSGSPRPCSAGSSTRTRRRHLRRRRRGGRCGSSAVLR